MNFLDIQLKTVNNTLVFDICYKPTNSFKNTLHLVERNHPSEIIDYTFAKRFQPKLDKNKDLEKNNFYEDMQC